MSAHLVCTAISNGEFYNRRRCGSEQRGTATLRTKSGLRTHSGRRILIQITFDVMNVRKPLLSTSALKHRGVTIIFNHDYHSIIFRNETVNLVSHDCHFYLHITLANGIPPRKAMVMAGENAAATALHHACDTLGTRRNTSDEGRDHGRGGEETTTDTSEIGGWRTWFGTTER